jgi:hypothetical protein
VKKMSRRYKLSNEHSFSKALKMNFVHGIQRFPLLGRLVKVVEEDGKLIYHSVGPLKRFGKLECEILNPKPYPTKQQYTLLDFPTY